MCGFSLDNLSDAGIPTPPWMGGIPFSGKSFCFVYWQSDLRYTYFMVATCFFGPLSVMALFYVKILSFTRNHKSRLATFRNRINVTRGTDLVPRLRMSVEETKITHTLVIVVACFVFCWAPFVITMILSVYYSQPIPRGVDFGSLLLGYANSMFNPIFHGVRNAGFRKSFNELYSKYFPCLKNKRTAPRP